MKSLCRLGAALVFAVGIFTVHDAAQAQRRLVENNGASLAEKLAVINAEALVYTDDIAIARFRFLLGALSRLSKSSQDEVGNMLVRGHKLLREKFGKDMKLLEFSEIIYKERELLKFAKLDEMIAIIVVTKGAE